MPDERPTAANIRGDIQQGATGDKQPMFDPAAAPLETDAEAGGAPMTDEQLRVTRANQPRRTASSAEGDGRIRETAPHPQPMPISFNRLMLACGLVIVLVLIAATFLRS